MYQKHVEFLIGGAENFDAVSHKISQGVERQNIVFGFDLDGTLVHAKPADHINVAHDVILENLLNNLWSATGGNALVLTGRPSAFTERLIPHHKFIVGTEHGSVLSLNAQDTPKNRIGNTTQIGYLRERFSAAIQQQELLKGVLIEDHKTVTMTLGFTHVINPDNTPSILPEMVAHMNNITITIMELCESILEEFPQEEMEENKLVSVDTVTPTNAAIEIMPKGACKLESLRYLRNQGLISNTFTVFSGDSGGDQKVMDAVRDEGGICLGVGPKAPKSSHIIFERPEHLRAYLNDFAEMPAARSRILAL